MSSRRDYWKNLLREYKSADPLTNSGLKKIRKAKKIQKTLEELENDIHTCQQEISEWMIETDCPQHLQTFIHNYYFENKTGSSLNEDVPALEKSIKAHILKSL